MNTKTKAAIERLKIEIRHALEPKHAGISHMTRDILTVCNAAEQRDDLLAKIEYERGEADTKRLRELLRISRSGLDEYWTLNNPDEVKAIDAAMKDENHN